MAASPGPTHNRRVELMVVEVEPAAFLAVVATAAVAGTLAAMLTSRGLLIPTVVAELVLGVVIGPEVLRQPRSRDALLLRRL
jgi:Kef-type K+ transport system membrane component KefB